MGILGRIVENCNEMIMSKTDRFIALSDSEYVEYKQEGEEAISNLPISFSTHEKRDVNLLCAELAKRGSDLLHKDKFSISSSGEV